MTLPCPRAGKWIRGCRFEARHDAGPARELTPDELYWIDVGDREAALRAVRPQTYILDICVTCGKTIERPAATSEGEGGEVK